MNEHALNDESVKNLMKKAISETLDEKKDFFLDLITQAIEDIGLAHAIKEGQSSPYVAKERIFERLTEKK